MSENKEEKAYVALPHQKSTYNLFEDPKMKKMFENLPEEEKKSYMKSGKYMYSKDYVNAQIDDPNVKIYEAVAYIAEGLKSGLLPSQLEENEKALMKSVYGDKWFQKYGYENE